MILLATTPEEQEEQECIPCRHCGTQVVIPCVPMIDTLPKLQLLLDGSLNTRACNGCGESVTANVHVLVNMERHGLELLLYVPLEYLELEYFNPSELSGPGEADRIFYSLDELARQVRARILIHRLPIEAPMRDCMPAVGF